MPRPQLIVRKVNAVAAQNRYILWLACKHTVSFSALDLASSKGQMQVQLEEAQQWTCPFCPDPPPVVRELTANQLWRAAGEP